jgi:crotonobetainyl-CoA:carnitine CoA-transferase CaiB-like acyl-CoA transferase
MPQTANTEKSRGPLHGVRVLDLSRVLTGPFCSMVLADLGAEIWKIEELERGDQTRGIPPFVNGEGHYYLAINRNKKSIAVDLKTPEGRQIVLDLAAKADIVLENFRPGVMQRLGLDYDTLREARKDIIICSITGYGLTGPLSTRPSFDLVTQALSGMMSINGEPDGPPTRLGIPMGDIGGGFWAAVSILAALQHRNTTGEGLQVDLSLLDGLVGLLGYLGEIYLLTGEIPGRIGSHHQSIVPYGRFTAKDGDIVLALHVGNFWRKFCAAVDREDLVVNPKFKTTADRHENRDELIGIVGDILQGKTVAEWQEILDEGDVPNGPVHDVAQALNQAVIRDRNMIRTTEHPVAGKVDVVGTPINYVGRFDDVPTAAAPLLGQHTRSILSDLLGYDAAKVDALLDQGVIESPGEAKQKAST